MNLDDFKKKAEDLKQSFQDNVVPEIKDKTEKAKKKTKQAKDSVVSFVEEKVIKRNPEQQEQDDREPDIIERYVNGEPVGTDTNEKQESASEKAEETEDTAEAVEETAETTEETAETTEETAETTEKTVETTEEKDLSSECNVEHVEGEVVSENEGLKESFMNNVVPKVRSATGTAGDMLKTAGSKLKDAASTVAPKVKDVASNLVPKVKETASGAAPKVKDAAANAGTKLKEAVQSVGSKVKSGAQEASDRISFETYRAKEKAKKSTKDALTQKIRKNLFPDEYDEHGKRITVPDSEKKASKKTSEAEADEENAEQKKSIGSSISESLNKYNAYSHAKTILTHKKLVMEHCVKAGIPLQGLTHDLSKFSPAEFLYGVKFFSGDRSPNEGEREDHGYSNAWMHHKGRNKHHFEYWLDYNIEANKAIPVKMPLKYVIEMFCDRVAAGKVYKKDAYTDASPLEYFEKGRARRNIHPETSDFLEKLLKMLAKKGEDYTFSYIRWFMKHHDDY